MTTLREWKERRPASDLKQTASFYHPSFGTHSFVNNLFQPAEFGGQTYEPSRFEIIEPAQDGSVTLETKITFTAFTQDMKEVLKSWRGAARMVPIDFHYQIWDQIGDAVSLKSYNLYVKNASADPDNVSIGVGISNPLTVATQIIYTPQEYPGLRNL